MPRDVVLPERQAYDALRRVRPAQEQRSSTEATVKEQEQVLEFLRSQHILTLATVCEDGSSSATPLFYLLHGGFCLYWVSSSSSRHSRNLASGREVEAGVHTATDRWKEIRGVQMRGAVQVVTDSREREEVLRSYAGRFGLGPALRMALTQSTLYRFVPSWIRMIDNSRHFGYKYEFTPSGGEDAAAGS